jgi:uncharacterized protein YggE
MIRTTPAPLQDGVTVTAIGTASAPATTAIFVMYVNSTNNTPITATRLQPIVDALVASGADPASIQLPVFINAPGVHNGNVTISGSISHPTKDMLLKGFINVGAAFAKDPTLWSNNAQVTLRIDDCSAVSDASRVDAIRRARERANATAHDLGVKLGAVQSAMVNASYDAAGSCSVSYNFPYNGPQQQSDGLFNVRVTTPVTLRFAIR